MWSNLLRVAEMHWDALAGNILNPEVCSFRGEANVCQNEKNLTGICSRLVCPIANSQYATVLEDHGTVFLYLKQTTQNALRQGWEKIKLSNDPNEAMHQLEEHLLMHCWWIRNNCMEDFLKITNRLMRKKPLKKRQQFDGACKVLVQHTVVESKEQEQELSTAKRMRYSREWNEHNIDAQQRASVDSGYKSNNCLEKNSYTPKILLCPMKSELDSGDGRSYTSSSKRYRRRIELEFEVEDNPVPKHLA